MAHDTSLPDRADVVVVGAGIAGLTAARRLQQQGRSPLVLDAGDHVGGRIETVPTPYAYLENGGIFHTRQYPALRALLAEVGLADDVVSVPTGFHSRVLTPPGWHHVDYGSLLGPVRFRGMGWRDKLVLGPAAARALVRRPSRDDLGDLTSMLRFDDRSSADVATRPRPATSPPDRTSSCGASRATTSRSRCWPCSCTSSPASCESSPAAPDA